MRNYLITLGSLAILSCEPKAFKLSTSAMESTIETNSIFSIDSEAIINRNDIIAFNMPSYLGTLFVFRMIAIPGDTLRITDSQIFINSIPQVNPETLQFAYILETKANIDDIFFLERGIKEFAKSQHGYIIFTTESRASDLREVDFIISVTKKLQELEIVDDGMFADFSNSNRDNLKSLYIPKAGDLISSDELSQYAATILDHEGVDVAGLQEYTFRYSYCFVLGDNRHNALDSRYIGLIPTNKLIGTVNIFQ